MATLKEADGTAERGAGSELLEQEDAVGGQTVKTPERRLVDISEEDFFKELEPFEYHCYSGWEEAVQGWARAAPLSCILLAQKRHKKPKHKEADNPAPLSGDPTVPNADSSASNAEHRCESTAGSHNSFKKSVPLHQRTGSWNRTSVAELHKDTSEWCIINAMQKTTLNLEEGTLRESPLQPHHLSSKYFVSDTRPPKVQKHRPNNTVVPIKNFTFLPPIKSPYLSPQKVSCDTCGGKKSPGAEAIEENCSMFDKKSGTRGKRVDSVATPAISSYSAPLTPKYRTCQRNPYLFSALSVSIPKRYQVPVSSKPDTVHRTNYSVARNFTRALQSDNAAGAQAHMKLYEGCEINV